MMASLPVPHRVTLADLLPAGLGNPALAALPVTGLDLNSTGVQAGDVFFACPGVKQDGRRFIDDAIARGAAAVLYEQQDAAAVMRRGDCVDINRDPVPVIPVPDLAQQVSAISARYFREPSQQLCCIGITGTNGKTTSAWWLAQLLRQLGGKPGLIGTLGSGLLSGTVSGVVSGATPTLQATGHTTPDAIRLQQLLFAFRQQGATHAVMEVSSHSLVQGRANAVQFSTALFTNLSRDHLDYHGTLEQYGAAKARLFAFAGLRHAVINTDDAFGAALATQCRHRTGLEVITCSVQDTQAQVHVAGLQQAADGVRGELVTPWGRAAFIAPVTGLFNVSNLLGVVAVLCVEGFALADVARTVATITSPPGRLQRVHTTADDIAVFVDFAHTPDALEQVLSTLRPLTAGKLCCVFGCGGDRDPGKRAAMGAMVSRLADRAIVTSDNPRSEKPEAIIAQVSAAMDQRKTMMTVDRRQAIQAAIAEAAAGDVVLLAGKGHEDYQEINGVKTPFSDVAEAGAALLQRRRRLS